MIVQDLFEAPQSCPECGGVSFSDLILAEKKDACYYKVKASAKVWPSAYASGRLVQCRKKGADNYGKSKNEGVAEGLDQPKEAGKAIQSLKNLAVMKSALTMQQLTQAGREAIVSNAINAAKTLEQKYLQNKQQGNAIFVRALRDEIDNFMRGAPINASFPESDNASELGDLLQGKLGKVNFQQGVAEAINPDITNPAFSHQQQIGDYLYVARYWSKGLKISAYDGDKQIGYAELMYQTAPFDDFADPKTTPKRVWLESEWTKVNPKYQRQGIMSTMYAYAKMLGNSVKPSELRSPDAKAAWASWRQAGDAKHLTSNEGVAEGSKGQKFIVTYNNSLSDDSYTVMVSADDEYDAKDKVRYALGMGDRITDVKSARGNEFTDREYKVFIDPRTSQKKSGIYDRQQGVAEGDSEKIAGRYDPEEFDAMVQRLKKLAGTGPMKTVYDPQRRVYRNVPVAQQPDKK